MSSETTTTISTPGALDIAPLDNAQLNGPFFPIEQEEVERLLSQAMRELDVLDGQASPKDKTTSAERNEQIALITRYRVILAPYKKLPCEILASIFLACSEGPGDRRYTYAYAHVCHSWRQIALNTPSLWNRIWVDYLYCERELEQTTMVKELISRSGGLPIDLICSVDPRVARSSATYEAGIFDIVTSISNRLISLSLSLPGKRSLVSQLLRLPSGLFDRLETLKIHASRIWKLEAKEGGHVEATETEDSINASGIVVFSNARNLRSIEFYSPFQAWGGAMPPFHAPWGQITTLTLLVRIAMNTAHSILAQCTALESCEMIVVDNRFDRSPAHLGNIILRNLRLFKILEQFVEDDRAAFMKPFVLPASLTFSCNRWDPILGAVPMRRFAPW